MTISQTGILAETDDGPLLSVEANSLRCPRTFKPVSEWQKNWVQTMNHQINEQISLELGRRAADRLEANPGLIEVAQANLNNWSRRNVNESSLIRCYEEWRTILSQPLSDICLLLRSDAEEARRLRQNSHSSVFSLPGKSGKSSVPFVNMQKPHLEHIVRAAAAISVPRRSLLLAVRPFWHSSLTHLRISLSPSKQTCLLSEARVMQN